MARNISLYPLFSHHEPRFEGGIQLADVNQRLVNLVVLFIWLVLFNQTNKTNQTDQITNSEAAWSWKLRVEMSG